MSVRFTFCLAAMCTSLGVLVRAAPPTIVWTSNPSMSVSGVSYLIEARGRDPDGNLEYVLVDRGAEAFAHDGGGDGNENHSGNVATDVWDPANSTDGVRTIEYSAESWDTDGYPSGKIYHSINIVPKTMSEPTSQNYSNVPVANGYELNYFGPPSINIPAGNGSGASVWVVPGYTNWGMGAWQLPNTGTFTFRVGQLSDSNHKGNVWDPTLNTWIQLGPEYTIEVIKGNQYNLTLSANVDTQNLTVGESVTFTAAGTEPGGSTGGYIWSGVYSGTTTSKSVLIPFNSAGSYSLSVRHAGDAFYFDSNTASISTITVVKNEQASVSVTPVAQTINTNQSVTFTPSGGSGDGNYIWSGAFTGSTTPLQPSASFTFASSGTYSVNVKRAGNYAFNDSNTVTSTITVNDVYYALTVSGGVGSGSYTSGTIINISASPPQGYSFLNWSKTGAGSLGNTNASPTAFTMGAGAATVTANFAPVYYILTVQNGSGSGSYSAGNQVPIAANAPQPGQLFSHWSVASGLGTVASATSSSTNFTMGTSDAIVQPVYYTPAPPVVVGLHAAAHGTTATQSLAIESWQVGSSSRQTTSVGGAGSGTWTSLHQYCAVTPGLDHMVKLPGSGSQRELRFEVPKGYTLYIGDSPYLDTMTVTLADETVEKRFFLVANDGSAALRGGYAIDPQLSSDDLIWAVSLGRASNGRTVGAVTLRKTNITGQSFTLDHLTITNPELPGVLDIYADADAGGPWGYSRRFVYSPGNCWLWLDDRVPGQPASYCELKAYDPVADPHWDAASGTYKFKIGSTEIPPFARYVVSSNSPTNDTITIAKNKGNAQEISWSLKKTVSGANTEWLLKNGTLQALRTTASLSGDTTTENVTLEDGSGNVLQRFQRIYQSFGWGRKELVSEANDPSGLNLQTSYTYGTSGPSYAKVTSATNPDGTFVRYEYASDDASYGKLMRTYTRWKDVPSTAATATASNARVVTNTYSPVYAFLNDAVSSITTTVPVSGAAVTTGKLEFNPNFAAPTFNGKKVRKDSLKSYYGSGASDFLASTKLTYHPEETTGDWANKLISETAVNGVKQSFVFYKGQFVDNGDSNTTLFKINTTNSSLNTQWGEYIFHGFSTPIAGSDLVNVFDGQPIDPIYMVANRSWIDLTVLTNGRPSNRVRYVFTGASGGVPSFEFIGGESATLSVDLAASTATETTTDHRGGSSKQIFTNGRLTKQVANDGMEVSFEYNALGWLIRKELAGVSASGSYAAQGPVYTHYGYDAAGRKISEKVSSSSNVSEPGPTATYHYDAAGRLDSESSPAGLQIAYSYNLAQYKTTATLPGGATTIVETYLDGSLKSVTGTAVVGEYHTTAVAGDGRVTRTVFALRSSDLANPTAAPRWGRSTTDWLGRTTRLESPSPIGGTIASDYTYNAKGQHTLIKTVDVGTSQRLVADTVIDYDVYERPYRSGVDLDAAVGLSPSSNSDRISETDTVCEKDSGNAWWIKTTTKLYNQPGSSTPLTTSTTKARLNKLSAAGANVYTEAVAIDLRGNQSRSTVTVDRTSRLVTESVDWPDSSADSVAIARNGLVIREQTASGLVTTHAYDSLRRLVCSTDPRIDGIALAHNLNPRTGFNDGTAAVGSRYQIAWVKDTAGNQTNFTYSSTTGRVTGVQQPSVGGQAAKYTYYDYTARGELFRTWGHVPHPAETSFNDYGETTFLKTFRGGDANTWSQSTWPATPPAADLTKWVYDSATGVPLEKYDAANLDANGQPIAGAKKVAYTYNKLGQIKTRTWERGVATTYKYYGEDAGDLLSAELKSVDYSDTTSTNPDLGYTYNRIGQVATISDLTGQRTFEYESTTAVLQKETLSGFFGSRILTAKYDTTGTGTLGRSTGFSLGVSTNSTSDYDVTYGYDGSGRPNSVTSGGVAFSYGYEPNSDLIRSVSESVSTWSQVRTWVSNRNLLEKIDTSLGSSSKAAFQYGHDELGRRTSVVQSGTMFDRYVGQGLMTRWGYNDRSEVISAQAYHGKSLTDLSYPVAGRGYTFQFDSIGNRAKSRIDDRETTYGINNLNQIKSRATPNKVEVSGLAPTASTVQANSQSVTRQGDYYHKAVDVNNASTAVHASITVTSSTSGASTTRKAFVAKSTLTAAEEWQYDDDGNLIRDDQWRLTWDGENRLVAMETRSEIIGTVVTTADARRLEFSYDYLGRRVRKVVRSGWNGSTFSATPDADTRFIYSGWNLVGEYNALSSYTLNRTFTWGLDLSGTGQGAGGVAGLLMSREGSTDYVYAYDGNGNVVSVINRSGGTVVAEYEYSPFGDTIRATGAYAQTNPFRFSTKYTDNETGLVYYGLRFYSPAQGRFLGRDPVGEQGGLNLYAFCGNDPINHIDYIGAITWEEIKATLLNIWSTIVNSLFGGGFVRDDYAGGRWGVFISIDLDFHPEYRDDPGPVAPATPPKPPENPAARTPTKVGTTSTISSQPSTPILTPPAIQPQAPATTPPVTTSTDPGPTVTGGGPNPPVTINANTNAAPGLVGVVGNATTGGPVVVNPVGTVAPTKTPGPADRPITARHSTSSAPNSVTFLGALGEQYIGLGERLNAGVGEIYNIGQDWFTAGFSLYIIGDIPADMEFRSGIFNDSGRVTVLIVGVDMDAGIVIGTFKASTFGTANAVAGAHDLATGDYQGAQDEFVGAFLGLSSLKAGTGPQPAKGGRLGKPSTRDLNADIATKLEEAGWKITHGGGRGPEKYLPGKGPGTKGGNFTDITATKNGKVLHVNTVSTLRDGVTPTAQEARAAAQIRAKLGPNERLILIPKKE